MKNQPATKFWKNIFSWIFWALLLQFILINISAAFHAHRITHYYNDESLRNFSESRGSLIQHTWRLMVGRKLPKSRVLEYPVIPYDTVLLKTANGKIIEGWRIKADSAIGTVILFHGLSSNKGTVLSEAYEFHSMGYNTFLIDLRSHGNSDGIRTTLGVKESEEVKLAFEYIKSSGEKNIILWGMSMGALVIAKAVNDYGIKPQKIIMEMPFARLKDHIRARARLMGFPNEPFGSLVTFWAGFENGFWGFSHNTSEYVKSVSCPVLIQWGSLDAYVLNKEIEAVYKNIQAPGKKLVVYSGSGHQSFLNADPVTWKNAVTEFLYSP